MKTVEISEFGDANVLKIGQRDIPQIRPGEVLVKVQAAGVNGPDLLQRRGHYPAPKGASDLLGLEVSGEIVALGEQVSNWKIGDSICALTNGGGYAGFVAIDAGHCLSIPDNVDRLDAAGLPETLFTVWSNFFYQQQHPEAAIFLVHGGAGGIGSAATQIGSALGLRVFTTCSSDESADYCMANGATAVINYRNQDFVDVIRDAGGANLILDTVGGDYIARNIKAASPDARIVQLAFNQGSKVDINLMPIMLKRLVYTGSTLRSRASQFKADIAADVHSKLWPLFADGKLRTNTHTVLPVERAIEAHQMMEASKHRGKILLTME